MGAMRTTASIERAHSIADELFERDRQVFGDDFEPYRGHVQRMIEFVGRQMDVDDELARPLAIAAFYHDAAIWYDGTWDYLVPSAERAVAELGDVDDDTRELVVAMIDEHHRVRSARHPHPIVEAFRKDDAVDVYFGLVRAPGMSRDDYKEALVRYPSHGHRPMLARAFGRGLRKDPLKPLPMVKL